MTLTRMGWSGGHRKTKGQNPAAGDSCEGESRSGRALGDPPGTQEVWLKTPVKQGRLRMPQSLCERARRQGRQGSDGAGRPERQTEAQWLPAPRQVGESQRPGALHPGAAPCCTSLAPSSLPQLNMYLLPVSITSGGWLGEQFSNRRGGKAEGRWPQGLFQTHLPATGRVTSAGGEQHNVKLQLKFFCSSLQLSPLIILFNSVLTKLSRNLPDPPRKPQDPSPHVCAYQRPGSEWHSSLHCWVFSFSFFNLGVSLTTAFLIHNSSEENIIEVTITQ